MSRKLLYILPIVLPFLLYGLYAWWAKRKALRAGIEDGGEEVQGIWHDAPWAWLGIVALLLFIATLIATALLTGSGTDGTYVPPHVIDGKIVPGKVE